jgi:hypothetical protein
MSIIYAVLFFAIATGVMQSSLDKAGVGHVESSPESRSSNVLVMLSIPITWLSNLGLIVITIWSFFALPWLPALGVIASAFIGFSLVWGIFLATLRRGSNWISVVAVGIPLVFVLRLVCAASIVYLGVSYAQGAP